MENMREEIIAGILKMNEEQFSFFLQEALKIIFEDQEDTKA